MKHIILAVLALGVLCGSPIHGRAGGAVDTPPAGQAEKKAKFRPFHGTVKTVDPDGKTITLQGNRAQQFAISTNTVIRKNGQPATLDSIATGDKVGGRARQTADGKWEAVTLNLGSKAAKEPPRKSGE
ncbi:MAG: hypothetical protein JXQ71_05000 [Verrucomicrobia bacterium]|nr:hypothetical protein [Verrucomicrobiota bacterium]